MTKLTELAILSRAKGNRTMATADLKSIRRLNLWGLDLDDVSVLTAVPQIEILSLSVNPISSLQVFQHLVNLRELYLRKNRISDLKELKFLQNLPHLSILWIDENPIAKIPSYRSTVLSLLPNLVKLDDIAVTEAEREITRDSQATAIWSHDASSPRSDIDALAPKLNVEEKSLSPVKSSSARNDRLSPVIRWDASIDRPLMPNEVTTTTDEEDELHHVPKHLKPTWLRDSSPIAGKYAAKERSRPVKKASRASLFNTDEDLVFNGKEIPHRATHLDYDGVRKAPSRDEERQQTPKSTNNVLMAVLSLLGELDSVSLRLVREQLDTQLTGPSD